MYNKYKSHLVSTIATFVFAACVIASCILLPFLVNYYVENSSAASTALRIALYVCLYGCAAPSLCISYLLLRILFNIRKNVVFDRANVRFARYISWCCFIVSACFFALGFFVPFSFI